MKDAQLGGSALLRDPIACTEAERRAFGRLVRQGFARARALEDRIRNARCLAFYHTAGGDLVAVAAIKSPDESYRRATFADADAPASAQDDLLKLGWVFVMPVHRRSGIAERLCRALVTRVSTCGLFATRSWFSSCGLRDTCHD